MEPYTVTQQITYWLGNFHMVFLHFPIALITLAALAEIINYFRPNILFVNAARFMVGFAALFVIPTIIFGLFLEQAEFFDGILTSYLFWHKYIGIFTGVFIILTYFFRELRYLNLYYLFLAISFFGVNIGGFFGSALTFGPDHLRPPFLN